MADIINLLPENIANQIAAGEVIQRPASAVKELLENAVDAGATEIQLFVNDAGKALVQVIDNGKGMSETDARMSFERHATSKIKNIDDLFHIKTMGFRGEALASIAGVAQVELKSKRREDAIGTFIEIENSIVKRQEPVATNEGTNICMKNLFFNVPARRNFLKSNASELRHIIDEFIRVAMAFPDLFFSLTSNGQQVFHLEKGSLKQRILQILGNNYAAKLVSVKEETDYMNIYGFAGKPETAKKTRGDQYFFVNSRFIKSAYLNHAVMNAFNDMIAKDSFPMYTLFIDIDPSRLDINVHPTKQEIKFEDEKLIYAFVQSAVKHALAQYSVTPTLDFELDMAIQQSEAVSKPFTKEKQFTATGSSLYKTFTQKNQAHFIETKSDLKSWDEAIIRQKTEDTSFRNFENENQPGDVPPFFKNNIPASARKKPTTGLLLQIQHCFIAAENESGFILIHQQNAHERVLYERFEEAMKGKPIAVQRSLFPAAVELAPPDAVLLEELIPDLRILGYQVEPFGKNSFIIQGSPADVKDGNEKDALEKILEQYKHFNLEMSFSKREKLLRSMAWQQAIKAGTDLSDKEMERLVEDLFHCKINNVTPNGKPVFLEFKKQELDKMFGR
ncbi:DNA mismatch repair endonuclease MutL [Hanamia caeni]|uniref:DNA mismatch repair protein MutL n=1 Tax=Hanamia caeni TaxID=2294116 RepID=A0A3M9NN88_9BACT|nr:DNA mismatch repair endonuclease MutL [Hanamia caeni]RNI38787.1 DNA mismatch repair endonuclease MutL [Hanamia caeni]